jgi:hypothetical protein
MNGIVFLWGRPPLADALAPKLGDSGGAKEVQDASCRGFGGVPHTLKVPQDWGKQGVEKTFINAFC